MRKLVAAEGVRLFFIISKSADETSVFDDITVKRHEAVARMASHGSMGEKAAFH